MAKVQATMSTEIALDLVKASQSIKQMTQLVNNSTSAWKAQESQLKAVGDYAGAAEAKFAGLGNSIEAQQRKIDALKQKQSELKGNTQQTAEQYLKYQQQIDQATTRLASLEAQQSKAKQSMEYYKSGLSDLQKSYKQQSDLSKSYVERLKAEGKENEVIKARMNGVENSINNLNKQYEAQVKMLKEVARNGNGDAYIKQKQRINETATAIANARKEQDKLNDEWRSMNPTRFDKVKSKISSISEKINDSAKSSERAHGIFSATFAANVISNGFQNALSGIKNTFSQLIGEADEYTKYQQTMNATWTTLTGSAEDGKKVVDITNEMAQAAANSTEMVDGMNQKFYAVTHNIDVTKQQTQAILTLQDAFGQTDAAVENFATQWSQMIANGKIGGQDMMSIVNVFPELKSKIKEVTADTYNITNMTTEQYNELQSKGKVTAEIAQKALLELQDQYKDATQNFAGTIGGMQRTINARMPAIISSFKAPIDQMKNPFIGKVSEWIADKGTQDRFTKLGETTASGLSKITDAFAKVFNVGDGSKYLNDFMDKTQSWIENFSKKIADHAPQIVSFFSETKKSLGFIAEIGIEFGKGAWSAVKGIFESIAKSFKLVSDNSKDSKDNIQTVSGALGEIAKHKEVIKTVGELFVGYFAAKKVASGVMTVVGAINTMRNSTLAMAAAQKIAAAAQWVLNIAMNANPIGLIVIAITAAVTAFALLYKHNKKFKKFVDDLAKDAKKAFDNIVKWFKDIPKNLKKAWENIKDGAKDGMKKLGSVITGKLSDIGKEWNKGWKKSKDYLSDRWNDMKDNTKKSIEHLGSSIKDKHDEINSKWKKTWKKSKDYLSNKWDEINKDAEKKFGGKAKTLIVDNLSAIGKKFQETWDGIKNGFSDLWNGLKKLAGNGINALIKIPNDGIDGINKLIADFGGSKNAIGHIPKVKFAEGTGFFSGYRNAITRPTLATLNDGNDSPHTGNQEMVIMPNGKAFLPQGRNSQMILPAGAEVLNATETAMLLGLQQGAYAKGTGFWSKIWNTATDVAGNAWDAIKDTAAKFAKMLGYIGDAVKDPIGTLAKKFNPKADKLEGLFNPLGTALFKSPVNEAKSWWKELWSMAKESSDSVSSVAMGAVGDDYPASLKAGVVWQSTDPWGYFVKECVSFVASRLNNLGVNPSLFSHLGNGNQWGAARVPHLSTPKPGTVAVYAKNGQNHVSYVTGVSGNTFSGEEYNYLGQHSYHQYSGRPISQADTFLDFGVRAKTSDSSEDNSKTTNGLRGLIKKQVGGMFDWIKKNLAPQEEEVAGALNNPQGGNVERWRSTVIKALKANGIDPTAYRVAKIMATIKRESNGDPNAQNNWDSNALAGHPSIGLMQTIGPTFDAYKFPNHGNIRNGYDNLLAAINYIKHRYGTSDAAFNRVAAYGYANGGLVSKHGVYELAEGNMPEYVIPTDIAKRGRAWSLLSEVVAKFAKEEPQKATSAQSDNAVDKLSAKLDAVIGLLSQLVTNGSNPIEIRPIFDGQSFANGLAPYTNKAQSNYDARMARLRGEII